MATTARRSRRFLGLTLASLPLLSVASCAWWHERDPVSGEQDIVITADDADASSVLGVADETVALPGTPAAAAEEANADDTPAAPAAAEPTPAALPVPPEPANAAAQEATASKDGQDVAKEAEERWKIKQQQLQMEAEEARTFQPHVVFVDADNKILATGFDPAETFGDPDLSRGDRISG